MDRSGGGDRVYQLEPKLSEAVGGRPECVRKLSRDGYDRFRCLQPPFSDLSKLSKIHHF